MTLELSYLPLVATLFMFLFARLGTMLMLVPALGETAIPTRVRLTLAILLTFVFYPIASPLYQVDSATPLPELGLLFASEMAIGGFIGLGSRLITYALTIAGVIFASQSGLSFALAGDPTNEGQQGAIVGSFLGVLGITLVFATDTHFLVIAALNDSFTLFPPADWMPVGDFAEMATRLVSGIFAIAVQMSAPFIIVGLVFYFGLGLLNKLMPQMQIFFISLPLNIALGILILFALLMTVMTWYLTHFQEAIGRFVVG
ncbi:flagellar type III secretion system protein FliR [Stappia sp. F7233]|uniref:Flagellar biosynthetic protein FliR n=1 Tax=Stappia albiluteola TaxID=2758565 RepID=A0A839ALG6_9HYPH|nr:flagellar biosynthetic protein FliR [Stappia albiluteola]MBA5779289.1 flagellar type III secretion system protein FliR [Stappia albiluteola]